MKQALGGIIRMAFFPVAILLPAGTLLWWEAWVVTAVFVGWSISVWVMLAVHDPELLKERLKGNVQEDQPLWDKVLMGLMTVTGLALIILPGLDVVRFGWSEPFPVWVEVIAMCLHVPALALVSWVMWTNTFLARVVKVDEDRGHEVITTGPYSWVRHPMYVGVILLTLVMPIALGSRWGLVAGVGMAAVMVGRTALEDRMLHEELAGYVEYARQTRFRLLPGVW
jgi:protein-S-isoprenylcysteine O-methyltransferase Ste14